jgi:hypothetical protein
VTPADTPDRPRFRWLPHLLVALGCAAVAPFTALAWPFALFTGFVVGRVLLLRANGTPPTGSAAVGVGALVAAGFLGMIVFGIAIGGLVAFLIVGLAAESERRAWMGTPRQQIVARIIVVALPTLVWLLLLSGPAPAGG